ncbi:MAG: hypothetical protein ACXWM7_03370 [Parachlamydiaceae bacterium]
MRYLLTFMIFLTLPVSAFEKKLSSDVILQYEDMQIKKDESKQEVFLKNPHLIIKEASKNQKIVGEIDLTGTLNVTANEKAHTYEFAKDGVTRLFFQNESDEKPKLDMTINGKMTGLLEMDMASTNPYLTALKAGTLSEEQFVGLLQLIKSSSLMANDLEIAPHRILENIKLAYRHTSGTTPEEITMNFKMSEDFSLRGYGSLFGFQESKKMETDGEIKLLLPEWKHLVSIIRSPAPQAIPESFYDMNFHSKSFLGEGASKISLGFKKLEGERMSIDTKIHTDGQMAANWVEALQKLKKSDLIGMGREENGTQRVIEEGLYQWIISSKTTPFLNLLPSQISFDWDGSGTYTKTNNRLLDTGHVVVSLLGKEKAGIRATIDYKDGAIDSQVTLLGGRSTFDYGIDLYNRFVDSFEGLSFLSKLPKFSPEAKEDLYQLLLKYVSQPEKSASEMQFVLNYSKDGVLKIGGKNALQFQMDVIQFYQKFLQKTAAPQQIVKQ